MKQLGRVRPKRMPASGCTRVICLVAAVALALTLKGASGFLDVDGSTISYEVAGAGPALVLLHDGLMHGESWKVSIAFAKRLPPARSPWNSWNIQPVSMPSTCGTTTTLPVKSFSTH